MRRTYRIGQETIEVTLESTADGTRARIGEKTIDFTLHPLPDGSARLNLEGGRTEIVHVARSGDRVDIHLGGRTHHLVEIPPSRKRGGPVEDTGERCAPMPGRIVKVAVAPGDVVEAKTSLVVLEAMKMEHHIRAGQPSVVRTVHVAEGDQVSLGALLVELETN